MRKIAKMSNIIRILYIQPTVFLHIWFENRPHFCTEPFLRISNYLNSKKSELGGEIEEEYLDLRIEDLPKYYPENVNNYRKALKKLLCDIYKRFQFDIVAISCYTSYTYLNSIEVAWMIKHYINPSSSIVVGGVHVSIIPEDLNPENLPEYFDSYYPQKATPFDYIVIDEGEIPFFNFVRDIFNGTINIRKNLRKRPIILGPEIMRNLDDIPPLNLDLFRKYENVNKFGFEFFIQFNRGCPFKCKFCSPSGDYIKSHSLVRFRSLEKCMADLKAIITAEWLDIKHLHIVDPSFFPKRSIRNQFFEELGKIYHELNFDIAVFDRVENCSREDLKNFKKYGILVGIGVESVSKKLLFRMGKVSGKNASQVSSGINSYLEKTKNLIKYSNEIDVPIDIFYLFGVPGTDKETLNERDAFFFGKKDGKKALIEKYKINLCIFIYLNLCGNSYYDTGEKTYGATYYYKEWWKIFDKYQAAYCTIISPSKDLSFLECLKSTRDFIKKVYKAQLKLKNPYYNFQMAAWYGSKIPIMLNKYEGVA